MSNKHMTRQSMTEYVPTVEELRRELQATAEELRRAYDRFDYVIDPNLVEASIYEIDSLKAKYGYLLRCIKERSGGSVAVPVRPAAVHSVAAAAMEGGKICPS